MSFIDRMRTALNSFFKGCNIQKSASIPDDNVMNTATSDNAIEIASDIEYEKLNENIGDKAEIFEDAYDFFISSQLVFEHGHALESLDATASEGEIEANKLIAKKNRKRGELASINCERKRGAIKKKKTTDIFKEIVDENCEASESADANSMKILDLAESHQKVRSRKITEFMVERSRFPSAKEVARQLKEERRRRALEDIIMIE